jgi:hypothetical protein
MTTNNNIYRINAGVNTDGLTLKSVYIPSIHRDYDVSTICYVFQTMFGTVCRIDRVEKTKSEPVFQSMFIYYYENGQNACEQNRVYPAKYVQNRQFLRKSPVGPNEYWVILPNKKMFPDTTLTLDEISQRFDRMEVDLGDDLKSQRKENEQIDQDTLNELAILSENREYLRELQHAQNTPKSYYLDTTVNIHQLAQNLQLMEDRYVYNKEKNFRFEIGGTTLFVENIPTEFREPELWEHFAELHPGVMGAKVCKHPKTKESMGFGYVCFDEGFDLSEIKSTFKVSIVV